MRRVVSCYSNSFGPAGVRSAVEELSTLGLGHVELALRPHDFGGLVIPESAVVTEKADDATVAAFLDLLRSSHVEVSGCNIGGGDLRTEEGFEVTASRLRFASRAFGAKHAVTGASQPADASERAVVVDHLRRLGELAGSLGVDLALETHKGPTQDARAMLALMDEVDHPRVRLNFDTGNIAYYNPGADPVAELERVKHLIRSVHLKDNRGASRTGISRRSATAARSISEKCGKFWMGSASSARTRSRSKGSAASPNPDPWSAGRGLLGA